MNPFGLVILLVAATGCSNTLDSSTIEAAEKYCADKGGIQKMVVFDAEAITDALAWVDCKNLERHKIKLDYGAIK